MWGQGGRFYDDVTFAISDALARAAQRLNAGAGERILDVATGTGWSARNVARRDGQVTAVDIAPELLAAAEELSAHVRPPIVFQPADAERLPFPSAHFDGIISTFGIMFALDQAHACTGSAQDAPTARQERVSAPPARMPSRCTESGRASAPRPRSVVSPTAGARAVDWRPRPG